MLGLNILTLFMGKVMDTEALAEEDRENQGTWEAEYSYLEGADTDLLYEKCEKNPGHQNFIPVHTFSMQNLPEQYRDSDVEGYIRAVSDLTVRVSAMYVSDRRPDTFPGTRNKYPGHMNRGKNRVTIGTGWVERVDMARGPRDACLCQKCLASLWPEKNFACIHIQTASHVVYDAKEAEQSTCYLYFDSGIRPEKCPGSVALRGLTVEYSQVNRDMCEMIHYTHDLDLAARLQRHLDDKKTCGDKVSNKLSEFCKLKRKAKAGDKHPLLFVVSHPHGCSKQITLGYCTNVDVFSNDNFQFVYDTPTCRGSSGAPACMLQRHMLQFMYSSRGSPFFTETHCGNLDRKSRLNYCSVVEGLPSLDMVNLDSLLLDEGTWADKFTCVEERDLHSDYTKCQKNPGHPNFLPLDALSMATLPPLYRKDEVMKFIRIVADLTVRVTVKYVSQDRPATVPGTDIMYPWYDHRGSTAMRVGSGVITEVDICKNNRFYPTCDCKECLNSPTPNTEYANIYIDTADHLVFDNLEAEHTSCDLFFDSGKTPETSPGVVTLSGMSHTRRDMGRGWCRLTHVTHDLDLAERIDAMMNVHDKCLTTMEGLYDYFDHMENGKHNGRNYARRATPLHVVISHPHGCAKQVSVGYLGNPGTGKGQCPYTSTTCPGSCGAAAVHIGWETLFPYVE